MAGRDPRLASLCEANGIPPLWPRAEGFPALTKIILEQQVSLDSAAAAYAKLEQAIGAIEPEAFLALDDMQLNKIGFSRQKAGYCRGLAQQCLDGALVLDELTNQADSVVRQRLLDIRGVGPWTADVYLLFALRRPDIWPTGDRALVVSMAENLPLLEVPSYAAADEMADLWKPWRAVAARMFWHAYLKRRGRSLV